MNRLQDEYQGRIDVLTVSPRSMRGQKIAGQYGTVFTPTFVFVRANGQIQATFLGEVDEERLRQELESLVSSSHEGSLPGRREKS